MADFKFQFQYDPGDLKAIRDANGLAQISPATTITVWAVGLAFCLLVLGMLAAWTVLVTIFVLACFFVAYYVSLLGRKSWADREFRVRTLSLQRTGVTEEFGNSMFKKTWPAFENAYETSEHFFLQHFEKVTAIPKRVIPQEELEACRRFISECVDSVAIGELEEFHSLFGEVGSFPIHVFRWQDNDIQKLNNARMRLFGETDQVEQKGNSNLRMFLSAILLMFVASTVFYLLNFISAANGQLATQMFLFVLAICIPFVFAFVWWRYSKLKNRNRKPRFPDDDIHVTCNTESLLIGYPKAIAKYGWQDIEGFYYSEEFVGFKPVNGMIHVIANHAFGSKTLAMEFLRIADALRSENQFGQRFKDLGNPQTPVETGNPFQSPGSLPFG